MIRDESSGVVLASSARRVRGLLLVFGLMFRRPLRDEGWVFELPWEGRWDVTNLFVFQDIDVIWLDADRRVLRWRTVPRWTRRVDGAAGSRFFIELPAGAASAVRRGHTLSWRY